MEGAWSGDCVSPGSEVVWEKSGQTLEEAGLA